MITMKRITCIIKFLDFSYKKTAVIRGTERFNMVNKPLPWQDQSIMHGSLRIMHASYFSLTTQMQFYFSRWWQWFLRPAEEEGEERAREEVGFPSPVFFYFGEGKTRSCLKQFVR